VVPAQVGEHVFPWFVVIDTQVVQGVVQLSGGFHLRCLELVASLRLIIESVFKVAMAFEDKHGGAGGHNES
jgi:hypothetical protein